MPVTIQLERPDTPDAITLIEELETHLAEFYPVESRHGFTVQRLLEDQVAFFVVREDATPVGCGGIKLFGTASGDTASGDIQSGDIQSGEFKYGELKRMYVRPSFRGRGLGKLLIDRLAAHARAHQVRVLRLETGIYQTEAIALYERAGFRRIPPFGDYFEDPLSLCYEMHID